MDTNINIKEKIIKKESKFKKFLQRAWTVFWIIFILWMIVTIIRMPEVLEKQRTKEIVEKIRETKLTIDDVMGKNLPPEPDSLLKDATVAGIDANNNGIRDDVELAIFKEHPNSAKMRAQLLQYALSLQITATVPFVNEEIATAWAQYSSKAYDCIGNELSKDNFKQLLDETDRRINFIEKIQFNTQARKTIEEGFYANIRSHNIPRDGCDIDLFSLPN